MEEIELRVKKLDKLINQLIFQAKDFTTYACFNYGEMHFALTGVKTSKFTYDNDYFNFIKCTKTLISIKDLLKINNNEDVMILIRSIFESYLSVRYFQENKILVDEFIINPIMIELAYYNLDEVGHLVNREKEKVGKLLNPSKFKLGSDIKYYNDFYAFLCLFAHANYGIRDCYLEKGIYTLDKSNYNILSRLFTIFVFTKLFESIVTVEGEDFPSNYKEKKCYQLVKDSLELQKIEFDKAIIFYSNLEKEILKFKNKRMKEMLKNMKKSLNEELGSLKK